MEISEISQVAAPNTDVIRHEIRNELEVTKHKIRKYIFSMT